MPFVDASQPVLTGSPRRSPDLSIRLVRLVLLLLVSPALVLVLVVGGFLLVAQYLSRGLKKVVGLFRSVQPDPETDPTKPTVLIAAKRMTTAARGSTVSR